MSTSIVAAVLCAAFLHAVWNTAVKGHVDRFTMMVTIAVVQTAIAVVLLPFAGALEPAAWPWLVATAIPHTTYKIALARAYDHGDMTVVYPVARGLSIALVTFASLVVLGEDIALHGLLGIAAIGLGVLALSWGESKASSRLNLLVLGLAFAAGVSVAGYTLIDGIGVRLSGNVMAFAVWMFILDGVGMVGYALYRRGSSVAVGVKATGARGVFAGCAAFLCYWIAIWALSQAPIALVAALRETSVFFSLLLGRLFLSEAVTPRRIVAGLLIVLGIVATRGVQI